MVAIDLDADERNADWAKTAWDLPRDPIRFLGLLASQGIDIDSFKKLPVYQWHVDDPGLEWLKKLGTAEVLEAFDPDQPRDEHGRWAAGGGASGGGFTSKLTGEAARQVTTDWSDGHGMKETQLASRDILDGKESDLTKGPSGESARYLLSQVQNGEQVTVMYRGMSVPTNVAREWTKGSDVTLPLSSFTTDHGLADFASYRGHEGRVPMVITASGKGFPIESIVKSSLNEVVSAGRFHIDEAGYVYRKLGPFKGPYRDGTMPVYEVHLSPVEKQL